MKNKIRSIIVAASLGLILTPAVSKSQINLNDYLTCNERTKKVDYSIKLVKEEYIFNGAPILYYSVCINQDFAEKIKDVEYYIDDTPVWSYYIDYISFKEFLHIGGPTQIRNGLLLESIKDFSKGVHKTKVTVYTNKEIIESEIKTFGIEDNIKAKNYNDFVMSLIW